MAVETNHSLSVDCVIFGYQDEALKVLLVEQHIPASLSDSYHHHNNDNPSKWLKLPGSMILEDESLPEAAQRVLFNMTGLDEVYLKQTEIFSSPKRVTGAELEWIATFHKITTKRVVTVGYYALIQITQEQLEHTDQKGAIWVNIEEVPPLALDHTDILQHTLKVMRDDFERSPIIFEMLPKKFIISDLQKIYSTVMGIQIDNRNFRKKILGQNIITATGERQSGVAHKPAEYFTFNLEEYQKNRRKGLK
ncbi:MAG: NUDIX domain-containing protein [Rikenellaceae bacterium]